MKKRDKSCASRVNRDTDNALIKSIDLANTTSEGRTTCHTQRGYTAKHITLHPHINLIACMPGTHVLRELVESNKSSTWYKDQQNKTIHAMVSEIHPSLHKYES